MNSSTGPARFAGESHIIADPELSAADRAALLQFARATLIAYVREAPVPTPPAVPGAALHRGAFVTLEAHDELRGCMGHIAADMPLGTVVGRMTIAAARDDPRFAPVEPGEVAAIQVEISVLTTPTPMNGRDPSGVAIGRDGVLVRRAGRSGLLLPRVAVEMGWGPEALLAAVCKKAGLETGAWRDPGTEVAVFQADVFRE